MITKVNVTNYRILRRVSFTPDPHMNIIVGDNESGKSTLFEAMALVLTGRINGRSAQEELNPFWFNQQAVKEYVEKRKAGETVAFPEICIEIFFDDRQELARISGRNNSENKLHSGMTMKIAPNPEYRPNLEQYFVDIEDENNILIPVEYYQIEWTPFSDEKPLTAKPKGVRVAVIDSKTIRSTSGIDYQMRQILRDYLDKEDQIAISLAFRELKSEMTKNRLVGVNTKLSELGGVIAKEKVTLAMDQGAQAAWDSSAIPHVDSIPFGMSGLGQQVAIKTELALARSAEKAAQVVIIEEPENHLSHTKLNKLIDAISVSAEANEQQIFIATHSSFVMNRLGLDHIMLAHGGDINPILDLPEDTVKYFKKLPGYDTLRMVLAEKVVLVEGASDEIMFERFYKDKYDKRPIEDGIDVLSMRGLSKKNCLSLVSKVNKTCALLTDNDGLSHEEIKEPLIGLLLDGKRELFIGSAESGKTLEPQIIACNDEDVLRTVLGRTERADLKTWMKNNKTEAAIHIAEAVQDITPPTYFSEAIEFIHGEQ